MAIQKVIITDYPDGSRVMSGIRNNKGIPVFKENDTVTATRVTTWYDGTPMDNSKADGKVYLRHKQSGDFYLINFPNWGETFLEKDTMSQMRALSSTEVLLIKMVYYKGVKLNGYYAKGDTPAPIEYVISTTLLSDDGGSVIVVGGIKLEHNFKDGVDIRYFGAKTDSSFNNTPTINKALRFKNITVDDIYSVSADSNTSGVIMPSDSKITFTKNGKFVALPSSNDNYQILRVYNVDNVSIVNPQIVGDRDSHNGTTGEWGHGIAILNSTNVHIASPVITNCWGDGIYIGNQYWDNVSSKSTENVIIDLPFCDNNRRNGISITSCKNVTVRNPVCINSNGVAPESGIDIEPEGLDGMPIVLDDINIINPYTEGNNGSGIMMLISDDVLAENNPFIDINILNHVDSGSQFGFGVFGCKDGLRGSINVKSPIYKNNLNNGVYVENYGKDNTIDLHIDSPLIKNWHTSNSTFDAYKHGISIFKSNEDAYANTNIRITNPSFESPKNSSEGFPINIFSSNPNKTSVVIEDIQKSDTYHKITPISKGTILNDRNGVFKGVYWEETSLQQIVSPGRLLGVYTNKDIVGNPQYTVNPNGWTDGQKIKFVVESQGYVTIFTPEGTLIPRLVSGNLSSNTIGSYIVLEHRAGKWFIVEEVGDWTETYRTYNNMFMGSSEPSKPTGNTVWIDTASSDIKIRTSDNTGWLPLRIINATKEQTGAVKQSDKVDDVASPDATDLATALTLVNELKTKLNAKFGADRTSGQQSTT